MDQAFYIENIIQKAINEHKEKFNGSEKEFQKFLDDKIPTFITSVTEGLADEIIEYCMNDSNDLKKHEAKINKNIQNHYGTGINLFKAFIELNSKIGSNTYSKYYKVFNTIEDQNKLDTLISIHVRACQISNEIRILITNGFADGAHARWRTLHELCVTFLVLYDNNHQLIEMYNDYEIIESFKKAKDYQETHARLGWEAIPQKEIEKLQKERETLIDKYGKEFSQSYGWAMNILPKGKRNFRELEKLVEKDYLRAIYTWSCENIHASISGVFKKIGLRESEKDNFLTGSNDYGFLDPIQFASYSLTEISSTFLNMEDSLMNKVYEQTLFFLQNELVKEFEKQEENY